MTGQWFPLHAQVCVTGQWFPLYAQVCVTGQCFPLYAQVGTIPAKFFCLMWPNCFIKEFF